MYMIAFRTIPGNLGQSPFLSLPATAASIEKAPVTMAPATAARPFTW